MGKLQVFSLTLLVSLQLVAGQFDPHFVGNRSTIVHLFEWRWNDIAEECERFLGPYGYGGLQTSPANENVIISGGQNRPWWERYQPISYKLVTRSGNEQEFQSMVRRCNAANVRVYVDVLLNHMTGGVGNGVGTGGSTCDSNSLSYPAVPFSSTDFNGPNCPTQSGEIESYQDANQVRNCRLSGLRDLNQGNSYVREKLRDFLNKLIGLGVAGFRFDAAKHMWPGDLKAIYDSMNSLSTEHGFPSGARPFIYQEVIDNGGEAISSKEYTGMGRVTEFKASGEIGGVLRKINGQKLAYIKNWGEGWGFIAGGSALVFVDNHDNQRGHGSGGANILTFRLSKLYKMAQAFFLAWPYGIPRVMSSYYWDQDMVGGSDRNDWVGPPHDNNWNTLPVTIKPDMTCGNDWMCEHRWRQIYNMNIFRNVVQGTVVENWKDNGSNQIGFARGDRGFLAINNDDYNMDATFKTRLPGGIYCDVITGSLVNGGCTGKFITVADNGDVHVVISNTEEDPMIAIHTGAKL